MKCHGLLVGTRASYLLGPGDKSFWFRAVLILAKSFVVFLGDFRRCMAL